MDDSMRDLVDLPDLENILPDIACAISRCYLPQRVAFLDLHRSIFLGLIRNGSGAYYHGNKGKKDESRCEEQKNLLLLASLYRLRIQSPRWNICSFYIF